MFIPSIPLGKYRHYKNILVEVIGVALHSETLEPLVVYKKLQDWKESKKGSIWVRPYPMFIETVIVDGKKVPRFEKIED